MRLPADAIPYCHHRFPNIPSVPGFHAKLSSVYSALREHMDLYAYSHPWAQG
jgi:hypothetical protein